MNPGIKYIEKNIRSRIISKLDTVGILYRLFSRVKDQKSINEKVQRKIDQNEPYSEDGKKMQDIIGIRIVTYFHDDIDLVKSILKEVFNFIDQEIDTLDPTVFKPKRTNIICEFDANEMEYFNEVKASSHIQHLEICQGTFELQLRTILSEGWHEIDHSLRYKCKDEWQNHSEKERLLNGIYANLEVNDLALKSLFSELSYNHFKEKNWEAMLRNKFRLKFTHVKLKEDIIELLNNKPELAKRILKLDRQSFVLKLSKLKSGLPLQFSNLIYLINILEIKDEELKQITPESLYNIITLEN